jgi:hypothetical protein
MPPPRLQAKFVDPMLLLSRAAGIAIAIGKGALRLAPTLVVACRALLKRVADQTDCRIRVSGVRTHNAVALRSHDVRFNLHETRRALPGI